MNTCRVVTVVLVLAALSGCDGCNPADEYRELVVDVGNHDPERACREYCASSVDTGVPTGAETTCDCGGP